MSKARDYLCCPVCETEFKPKGKHHRFCQAACKGKWKYITKSCTTEGQYKQISGNWSRYLTRLIYAGGVKRANLTVDILLDILEKQSYKCALTGLDLTCNLEVGKDFPTNVSVDRIEAGGPYIAENIQLVCKAVNKFRGDLPLEEFKWWCKKVVDNG